MERFEIRSRGTRENKNIAIEGSKWNDLRFEAEVLDRIKIFQFEEKIDGEP